MSYILEALADSEQARQRLAAAPRYSLLPAVGEAMPRPRVWPYALAGALLVNAAVLQLWPRPASTGSVASIKAPMVPLTAETEMAAAAPRMMPSGRSETPAVDVVGLAPREAGLLPSHAVPAYELRAAPAPADVKPRTATANVANEGTPMHTPRLAPKATAKRNAGLAVATGATPTVVAKVSTAPVAATVAASPAIPKVAAATTGIAAAPALTAAAPAAGTELPPALQSELPALAVAGFIRDEGSSGMVIVNDRLAREGDEVAPGVKLEKIVGDSLVFNYKGYRFKR